ncbi:MAG: DUF4294 domain-containing protein [Saprospiraceae bacterium]|nr:DUF4294 domain-containing protein [Saprospiraceae bacterium]
MKSIGVIFIVLTGCFFSAPIVHAQHGPAPEKITINGQVVTAIITEDDTLYVADLSDVSVTSKRHFKSKDEYALYMRYRRYANKVYPYAVDAIRIFRELEEVMRTMKPREQRKHIRRLQKELKDQFEDPLKNLSRTQGRILVHMIEKELQTPMYFLIKDLKNGLTANYWNTAGKLYGYNLRRGYVIGEDPILDIVLEDFDISHKL